MHAHAVPAEVVDGDGRAVAVSGRGTASAEPALLSVDGGRWTEVVAWTGPWPMDERWWDSDASGVFTRAHKPLDLLRV